MAAIDQTFYPQLKKSDAVITEASYIRKGGLIRKNAFGKCYGHAGVPDLVQLFGQFTRHIIFTHYGTWFLKNPGEGRKKISILATEEMVLDAACDGKEFEI